MFIPTHINGSPVEFTTSIKFTPTHPEEFLVELTPGEYTSSLKSFKKFAAGDVMADMSARTIGPKTWTSVQFGPGDEENFEYNTDLVYMNHSCAPNAAMCISSPDHSEWCLRAIKDINPGEHVTFFYPSTEWEMVQPFECRCGDPTCLKIIRGAKYISEDLLLTRGYIHPWILQLVRERDSKDRADGQEIDDALASEKNTT